MELDAGLNQVLRWRRILELTEEDSCLDLDAGTDAIPPHIVTNLVDTGAMATAEEREELYQGLLRFLAVMVAQITSALQEGADLARRQREGDANTLLQLSTAPRLPRDTDVMAVMEETALMQRGLEEADPFGHVLRGVQRHVETMLQEERRAQLQWIQRQAEALAQEGPHPGHRLWQERMWRLRKWVLGPAPRQSLANCHGRVSGRSTRGT